MKRVGMTWRVKPAHWEEYKQIHLNPWPELIQAIQEVGIHNYSIFAFPQKDSTQGIRVFAYLEVEGDDVYEALNTLAKTGVKKKWDEEVGIWVSPEAEEGSGVQFMELETIFYCQ
jgi:L-rhamnose mutarotase